MSSAVSIFEEFNYISMQLQRRALKLRIYPSLEQETLINKTFGCCRQIYNTRLYERTQFYENIIKPEPDKNEQKKLWKKLKLSTEKELKEKFPYLKEVSSVALQQARMDCEQSFKNFFNSIKGKTNNKQKFPKFKSKKKNDSSYREIMIYDCLDFNNRFIKIPKLGKVKFKNRKLNEWFDKGGLTYKNITVRKNAAGQYFAIILCEREYNYKKKIFSNNEKQAIGLDFSPAELYIDSDCQSGKDFNYKPQKQNHKKQLSKLQRRLSKKKKGSKNREKARLKVARLENHIANSRLDFIEKETLRLVRRYQVIGVENLNLIKISKFLPNAKNMVDTSWGTFVSKLKWKASKNENNCQIIKSDRFFASSQICSCCGYQNKKLKLSDRVWTCPSCGEEHIRDFNAAKNLKNNAIKILREAEEFKSVENVESCISTLVGLALDALDETERTGREIVQY
jgi:putative transposase